MSNIRHFIDRNYTCKIDLSKSDIVVLHDAIQSVTHDICDLRLVQGMQGTYGSFVATRLDDIFLSNESPRSLTLTGHWDSGSVNITVNIDSQDVYLRVEARRADDAKKLFEKIVSVLELVPGRTMPNEKWTPTNITGFSDKPFSTDHIDEILTVLKSQKKIDSACYSIARRSSPAVLELLEDYEELKSLLTQSLNDVLEIDAEFEGPDFRIRSLFDLPRGRADITLRCPVNSCRHSEFVENMSKVMQIKNIPKIDRDYRSGTLTYKIGKWDYSRFIRSLMQISPMLSGASGFGSDEMSDQAVPHPMLTEGTFTRDGRPSEGYDGPVEVLIPATSLEDFITKLSKDEAHLRAVYIGLEGLLAKTLNLSINVRDARVVAWSTQPLDKLIKTLSPLIDSLDMKLIEGRPGISLTKEPGFIEITKKGFSGFTKTVTTLAAAAALLGISVTGSDIDLVGNSSVSISHPVENSQTFKGEPTSALVVDWSIHEPAIPWLLRKMHVLSKFKPNLDIFVYRNGERVERLSEKDISPGHSLALPAGTYRLDLDHPRLATVTVFVNAAAPESYNESTQ